MTQNEIIELAIQGHASTRDAIRWAMNQAILAEREACAQIVESVDNYANPMTANDCADAIRARSNT